MEPSTDQLTRSHSAVVASHGGGQRDGLIDVLDRVLDKGVVIAGDIRINLLDIELLTIKVRLLISSADKAKELGIDWWTNDPHLSSKAGPDREKENKALRDRVERLEAQLKTLTDRGANGAGAPGARRSAAARGE